MAIPMNCFGDICADMPRLLSSFDLVSQISQVSAIIFRARASKIFEHYLSLVINDIASLGNNWFGASYPKDGRGSNPAIGAT